MKVKFLGTGAADWSTRDFNSSEFRRFSSAIIDKDLLIDPGPHIFHFAKSNGLENMFDNIKNIIVTHSHPDHFNSNSVYELCSKTGCHIFGEEAALRKLNTELSSEQLAQICFTTIKPFESVAIGDYSVWALQSNHATRDPLEITFNYAIEKDGKKLFWGTDGAWFLCSTWNRIRKYGFDAMVFEATIGDVPGDDRIFSHNSTAMLKIMLETIRKQGCLATNGKAYCTHLAKTLHPNHDTVAEQLKELELVPMYDGEEIEI